jgi:hypothetical protein
LKTRNVSRKGLGIGHRHGVRAANGDALMCLEPITARRRTAHLSSIVSISA